jgi:hypothetical protein
MHLYAPGVDRNDVSVWREGWCVASVSSCMPGGGGMSGPALCGGVRWLSTCCRVAIDTLHMTMQPHQRQCLGCMNGAEGITLCRNMIESSPFPPGLLLLCMKP